MLPIIYVSVPSYSLFAAIGLFVVLIFLYLRIDKYGLLFSDFLKMSIFSMIFCIIGSRLFFFFSRIPWLLNHFSLSNLLSSILSGGLVFYGGLIGFLVGIYCYCKRKNIEKKKVFDLVVPGIPLFHIFGRIGCFLAGCCYGANLDQPLTIFGAFTIERIPIQIVESIFNIILFIVIMIIQKRHPTINILRIYMLSYATFRFIAEFFRGDEERGYFIGISTSQLISIVIIMVFIIISCKNRNRQHKKYE